MMANTELDRLIAMLEPQADLKTVNFVRARLGDIMQGIYTNEYVPRLKLDDEVFPPAVDAEINTRSSSREIRTEQQRVDVYEVEGVRKL